MTGGGADGRSNRAAEPPGADTGPAEGQHRLVTVPIGGPFSLSAAATFAGGFGAGTTLAADSEAADGGPADRAPADRPPAHRPPQAATGLGGGGPADKAETRVRLAFVADGRWRTVGASVTHTRAGLAIDVVDAGLPALGGVAPERVAQQVARIFSVDVDGSGFAFVARRDPVVQALAQRWYGLRPVSFPTPYEAACWAVLTQRMPLVRASAAARWLTEQLGGQVRVDGLLLTAFPPPDRLAAVDAVPGLNGTKVARLRAVAAAAIDGQLDAAELRALPRDEAITQLRRIDGIGPFSAELVLLRGAGDPDGFPATEPRVLEAMRLAYHLPDADHTRLAAVADGWRPFRTWASVLLRCGYAAHQRGDLDLGTAARKG